MATTIEELEGRVKAATALRYKGEYQKALDEFRDIITTLCGIGERWAYLIICGVLHQAGVTFQNMGTSSGDQACYGYALMDLRLSLSFRMAIEDSIGIAYTAFQIPMCRLARGDKKEDVLPDFEKAEKAIKEALSELDKAGDVRTVGDMYQNLAYIAQQGGDTVRATGLYLQTMACRNSAKDQRGRGLTAARLAECYLEMLELKLAKEWAEVALPIFREIGDQIRIKQVEAVIAKIQEKEKK